MTSIIKLHFDQQELILTLQEFQKLLPLLTWINPTLASIAQTSLHRPDASPTMILMLSTRPSHLELPSQD